MMVDLEKLSKKLYVSSMRLTVLQLKILEITFSPNFTNYFSITKRVSNMRFLSVHFDQIYDELQKNIY